MSTTIFKTFITGKQAIAKTFVFAIAIVSVATMVFLAGCSARRGTSATTEEGVVINGVRWATRNADGFRTFVSSPEELGGFYAWRINRARDRYTLNRQRLRRGGSQGNSWYPCPPGWRLPTIPEFVSLFAAGSIWTTVNGVNGRLFGTAPHQLFLPAAGQFVDDYQEVRSVNEMGFYWISPESEPPQPDSHLTQVTPRMLNFSQERNVFSAVPRNHINQLRVNPQYSALRYLRSTGRYDLSRYEFGHAAIGRGIETGAIASPFAEVTVVLFSELSVRCVAVTADD